MNEENNNLNNEINNGFVNNSEPTVQNTDTLNSVQPEAINNTLNEVNTQSVVEPMQSNNTMVNQTLEPINNNNQNVQPETPSYGAQVDNPNNINNGGNKKQINPKIFIIVGIIVLAIIGGILFFKKGGISAITGDNLTANYEGKYNAHINYLGYYTGKSYRVNLYNDTSIYGSHDNEISNITYFDFTDKNFTRESRVHVYLSTTQELVDNDDLLFTMTSYRNYFEYIKRHPNLVKSHKESKLKTKKIGGREYQYFKGTITNTSGKNTYYVSFETNIGGRLYYSVNYQGIVDIDNKLLKGFLNIKVDEFDTVEELKASEN